VVTAKAVFDRVKRLKRVAIFVLCGYIVAMLGITVGVVATTHKGPFPDWYRGMMYVGFFAAFWVVAGLMVFNYVRRMRLSADDPRPAPRLGRPSPRSGWPGSGRPGSGPGRHGLP
jgi:hypothetical protein